MKCLKASVIRGLSLCPSSGDAGRAAGGAMGQTIHVIPIADLIDHEDNDCICGPTIEHVPTDDGDGWLITHHSLDGREHAE